MTREPTDEKLTLESNLDLLDTSWFNLRLSRSSSNVNETLHTTNFSGGVTNLADLIDSLVKAGGHLVRKGNPTLDNEEHCDIYVIVVWPDSIVRITYFDVDADGMILESDGNLYSTNEKRFDEICKIFKQHFKQVATQGAANILAIESGRIVVKPVGKGSAKLERENYSPQVMEDFDHVVSDFETKTPCGRIILIDGEPGTGKTYMIRALMNIDARFIIIPSNLVAQVISPNLLTALCQQYEDVQTKAKKRLALILEDADDCLVPRNASNISEISALLNLSDGIIGSLLDLRIICTTNTRPEKIDPAIMRDGRLCRQISVGYLHPDHAVRVYHRLTGKERAYHAPVALATVYKHSRGMQANGDATAPKRAMGFGK